MITITSAEETSFNTRMCDLNVGETAIMRNGELIIRTYNTLSNLTNPNNPNITWAVDPKYLTGPNELVRKVDIEIIIK